MSDKNRLSDSSAKSYSQALYELASEEKKLNDVEEHTISIIKLISQSEDFNSLIEKDPEIDIVLLACTHYPIIATYLEEISDGRVKIISQGPIVAEKLKDYLNRHETLQNQISQNSECVFLTTEKPEVFNTSAEGFLSMKVNAEQVKLS